MKKNSRLAIVSVMAVIAAALLYGQVFANPGGAEDPLVSKSYVDGQIALVKALITAAQGGTMAPAPTVPNQLDRDAVVAEVLTYMETVYGEALRQALVLSSNEGVPAGQDALFAVVEARAGQTLIALGNTEIILRSGSAVVVSGENGLCDITDGVDITNGMSVRLNHLLLVPVSDGRGMRFTSDAFLLIKGGYYFAG
jgi:hypothetical protein